MPKGALRDNLVGENYCINIHHTAARGEVASLVYPTDECGPPPRCSLAISNYRVIIRTEDTTEEGFEFSLPLMSIDSLSVQPRSTSAVSYILFPWTWGQRAADHDAAATHAMSNQASPQSFGQGDFDSTGSTLKISSKHLWEVEVLLLGERLDTAVRNIWRECRATKLENMPAFTLYRKRYATRREDDDDNDNNSAREKGNGVDKNTADHHHAGSAFNGDVASLLDTVEFGWNLYDPGRELERQSCMHPGTSVPDIKSGNTFDVGVKHDLRPWFRVTSAGQPENSYGSSPTYPFRVVVPSAASDALLAKSMTARSHARFPAVSFVHLGSGAVLARSSQPLTKSPALAEDGDLCAMLRNSGYHAGNAEPRDDRTPVPTPVVTKTVRHAPPPSLFDTESDETLMCRRSLVTPQNTATTSSRNCKTLFVVDCRPSNAAHANLALGGGYESGSAYDFCEVKFYGIENIHSISKSFTKLKALIHGFNGRKPKENFLLQLHGTGWLYHIQRVLLCSNKIAMALDRGDSCLVHCTDGWDRTPQCTATAMLLLDPFYRTIVGFCLLVEKEFCSFGHKFAERCGHQIPGNTTYTMETTISGSDTEPQQQCTVKLQPSPIFMQWMDVVFQVVRQFPQYFEFTPRLLEYLSEEVYACLHGTFLCNGEKERMFEGVRLGTASIWTDVVRAAAKERAGKSPLFFVNETYDSVAAWEYIAKKRRCGIQRISPNCSSKRLVFWESFYLRYDGDNCGIDPCNGSSHVMKKVVFHQEWEDYFNKILKDSCAARRSEIVSMRRLLRNLDVARPAVVTTVGTSLGKGKKSFRTCHQCRKNLNFFSTREQCAKCGAVFCTNCAVFVCKKLKMCADCHKLHAWNSQ